MAFELSTPLEHGGKVYPYCGIALVTNPQFNESDVGAQVVLHLYPYRVNEEGKVERPMTEVEGEEGPVTVIDASAERGVVFGNAYASAQGDPALAKALGGIGALLQEFITVKGM